MAALVEGNSLRGTARLTGAARMTVEKLLRDLGAACTAYHDAHVRGLTSHRIQCDEIWSFVGAKHKNVSPHRRGAWGDCWTWTALDADTKLMVSWLVGPRDAHTANAFMADVAARLANRVQLTTDGNHIYLAAVESALGSNVDYAMLEKRYGGVPMGDTAATRYSPARITGVQAATITGRPHPRYVSTSYVERQNLTMRMHMRRFTRLTNAFSKKIDMHAHAVALHFMYYNFCKIHGSLRVTTAMESRLTNHAWDISELIRLLSTYDAAAYPTP